MSVTNIERFIEGSVVTGLRGLFHIDPDYKYEENDTTGIKIFTDYPEVDDKKPIFLPMVVMDGLTYSFSDLALDANRTDDIIENGKQVGVIHKEIVPFSCRLIIIAETNSDSKDIAGKVIHYMRHVGRSVFEGTLGIRVRNMRKSPGGYTPIGDKKVFSTTVSLDGEITMEIRRLNRPDIHIAQKFIQQYIRTI